MIHASVTGSWYDALQQVSGVYGIYPARGLNTIGSDLVDVEQHRFLFRTQNLNLVFVATGSNFALLSSSIGTAPNDYIVLGTDSYATGTLVALLSGSEGSYGSWSVAQISGSFVNAPKNLVIVRDAYTFDPVTSSYANGGQQIYGLLQVESSASTGDAFNDTTRRSQISFVRELNTNGTSSFTSASAADIGGRVIQYSYVKRINFDSLPEDAYLSNTIFVDYPNPVSSAFATLTDITLQRALDNQSTTVALDSDNTSIRLAAGVSWTFLSGTTELWKLVSDAGGANTLTYNLNQFRISSSLPSAFQLGIQAATGSTQINIGTTAGQIDSAAGLTLRAASGSNLVLSGGTYIQFGDGYGGASTYTGGLIPFATSTAEWNSFQSGYPNYSVLGAFNFISSSLSSSLKRYRAQAGINTTVNADVNVTYPTNLDAPLLNYTGRAFSNDLNIYLNGILLVPGTSITNPNDVYPGTAAATGDLKFPMRLRSGSIITVEIFGY
jgi:hypothetical protein